MTPADRIAQARTGLLAARAELTTALATDRSRKRGAMIRDLHEVQRMLDTAYPYRSQAGQDRIVDGVLNGKTGGVFVDIGGYDGVTGSNTLFFEERRGWTGVLVEPVPAQCAKAAALRRCPCLPYAIAATEGEAEFIEISEGYTQMSGLHSSYDAGLLDKVRRDPRHKEVSITVQTRTIAGLLSDAGIKAPDFVSLDIEGGELAALQAFPFDQFAVAVWAIENNTGSGDIAALMRANGYQLIEFAGPDEIYKRDR